MSDEENTPEAEGDDAAFEELVKNQSDDDEDGPVEINTPWDGYEYIWKKFHAGDILVRGIFLAEYITDEGDQDFIWMTSPDMTPWTARGLLQQALSDIQDDNIANMFSTLLAEALKDKEEEDDDEEGPQ